MYPSNNAKDHIEYIKPTSNMFILKGKAMPLRRKFQSPFISLNDATEQEPTYCTFTLTLFSRIKRRE